MKQTQWGKERRTSQTEVVIEGGKKKEKKKAGGNVCVCVRVTVAGFCVARIGSAAKKRKKSWAEMANLRSVKTSGCICVRAETRRGLRVCEGFSLAS